MARRNITTIISYRSDFGIDRGNDMVNSDPRQLVKSDEHFGQGAEIGKGIALRELFLIGLLYNIDLLFRQSQSHVSTDSSCGSHLRLFSR